MLIEPPLELAHGNDDPPPLAHDPDARHHVLVEVVSAHTEARGCLRRRISEKSASLAPTST